VLGSQQTLVDAFVELAARLNVRVHTVEPRTVPERLLSIARDLRT
jgi:hypothetical protein